MKKVKSIIAGTLIEIIILFIGLAGFCVSVNIRNFSFWLLIAISLFISIAVGRIAYGKVDFGRVIISKKIGSKGRTQKTTKFNFRIYPYIAPVLILVTALLFSVFGSSVFNAEKYASVMQIKNTEFSADINESAGTDSIALMDTSSAEMLGDREIGALSNVVSQFDVSYNYSQIDYKGKPVKVAPLIYAGFFKWQNNKDKGVCGYVTVDPVSMTASYKECTGMKYVPSAYFFENAKRYIWLKYPTVMFDNLHFEIDEAGNPFFIATVYKKTIGLFGGKTADGCIVLNPITGKIDKYDTADIPKWIDIVFDGDLLCEQFNWNGLLQNGYLNSLIGKKDCRQITTYSISDDDDDAPVCDYGYVAKDGDIWIYTGITSLNGDSSNIGFLLANERTGEAHCFNIAGADEKSAMASAEGEVQEKGYQASFPSLINVSGNPTYIMVLKDSGGLVKLYAAVNVEQYNIVTTAATQKECILKYKELLGIVDVDTNTEKETTVTAIKISDIKYIDIDGNTYIYLISEDKKLYKAKASSHEDMLLLSVGDTVEITHTNEKIVSINNKK